MPTGHTATARERSTQAVLVAIAGIGLLSLMDAAVKEVATTVPTWEIVFLRYLFGTLFALPMFLAHQRRLPPMDVLRAHLLRSVAVVMTATTFFYALGALPLAVTLALSFTSPIMIALLARSGLGERVTVGVADRDRGGLFGCADGAGRRARAIGHGDAARHRGRHRCCRVLRGGDGEPEGACHARPAGDDRASAERLCHAPDRTLRPGDLDRRRRGRN